MFRIQHTEFEKCSLQAYDIPQISSQHIAGPTLSSLVSPGTEINSAYSGSNFPKCSGYAVVFRVEEIGDKVEGFTIGDLAFAMGNHQAWSIADAQSAIKVPAGLKPEIAVMARLMGVSQTTLVTCKARPGNRVLITGLGPVGYLAALQFQLSGYEVYASDPNPHAISLAERSGITVINDKEQLHHLNAHLAIDCSGHESAVIECAKALRRCGELVLIGVPWKKRSDATAHEILNLVFHRYIYLRSGWEWEVPKQEGHFNQHHSIHGNLSLCLKWLAEEKIQILPELYQAFNPRNCDSVYQGHLHLSHKHLCSIFDWTTLQPHSANEFDTETQASLQPQETTSCNA